MAITREDLGSLLEGAFHAPTAFYQSAVRLHKKWYWAGISSLMLLIALYVVMSYAGHPGIIAIMNFVLILILGFYVSAPATFLTTFVIGAGWRALKYDVQWENLFKEGEDVFPNIQVAEMAKKGLNIYVDTLKIIAHVLILTIAAGTILELMRVEHPLYALMFFPIIAAIGLWTIVHNSEAKWYRRITFVILFVGAVASFYKTFVNEAIDPVAFIREIPSYVTRGEEDWQLVEVIDCQMGGGEQSWNKNLGWCTGQSTYEAGSYRFTIRVWDVQLALWGKTPQITGYTPIPNGGISLDQWSNTSFENEFLRSAPIGGNRRLGSLIARVGNGKAFEATEEFEINPGDGTLSISLNLPQSKDYFAYNQGMVRVEVERATD